MYKQIHLFVCFIFFFLATSYWVIAAGLTWMSDIDLRTYILYYLHKHLCKMLKFILQNKYFSLTATNTVASYAKQTKYV